MRLDDFAVSPPAPHSLCRWERVEQRLKDLESHVREAEYRIRMDLIRRDGAWRERITAAMSLVCRMLAAVLPDAVPRGHREDPTSPLAEELPVPELKPRAITLEEYHADAPEKVELLKGYLISPADDPEARRRLLRLLLVNVGLVEAVALAPEERWREALRRVYS